MFITACFVRREESALDKAPHADRQKLALKVSLASCLKHVTDTPAEQLYAPQVFSATSRHTAASPPRLPLLPASHAKRTNGVPQQPTPHAPPASRRARMAQADSNAWTRRQMSTSAEPADPWAARGAMNVLERWPAAAVMATASFVSCAMVNRLKLVADDLAFLCISLTDACAGGWSMRPDGQGCEEDDDQFV